MALPDRPRWLVSAPLAMLALAVGTSLAAAGGAETAVEAGVFRDFVAPDAGTATPGSITFGFSGSPEVIAADAQLVPPADTNLAFLGGGTPTCIEVTRAGGVITRLAFVSECTVSGTVELVPDAFGPGADGYLIADRVAAPAELVDMQAEFAALIGVAADSGGVLTIIFQVDVTSGVPEAFVGETEVSGPVTILGSGDVTVGSATLPAAVIDGASRAVLEEAAGLGADATVLISGNGTIQPQGNPVLEIVLSVSFVAATPPATPAPTAAALPDTSFEAGTAWPASLPALTVLVAVTALGAVALRRGKRP
jgi:hypothetical protein